MNKLILVCIFATGFNAHANIPAKASLCVACHGQAGKSTNPIWPNLAGQKVAYLSKAMTDYKNGNRKDPLMSPIATGLTEKDIQELAEYFSSQEP